jgi:ankyrin repeat protein
MIEQRAAARERRAAEAAKAAGRSMPIAADLATFPVKVTPTTLELGDVPVGDSGKGFVTLSNTGAQPVVIKECKSSCGCTAVDCPAGRAIAPGEELAVHVSMRSDPIKEDDVFTRHLSKTVTLVFEGDAGVDQSITVRVNAESVAYVVADPTFLDPSKGEHTVELRSRDGQSFRVLGMTPPLLSEIPEGAADKHLLSLDWEKWKELGSELEISFQIEHPKASRVAARVRPHAVGRRVGDLDPTTGPLTGEAGNGRDIGRVKAAREIEMLLRGGDVPALTKEITEGRLEVDAADEQGATLLARATRWGEVEMVKALIELGAKVDGADQRGRTPLMLAAQSGAVDVMRVLLAAGASITHQDSIGTALCWAAGFGRADAVKVLIEAGSDVNVVSARSGYTPLIWAAGYGDAESIQPLIEAGAAIEATDTSSRRATALMHAASTGGPRKVGVLAAAGAALEARDRSGRTVFLVAAGSRGSSVETLKVLAEAGADVKARDANGATALDLALARTDPGAAEVIAYLRTLQP